MKIKSTVLRMIVTVSALLCLSLVFTALMKKTAFADQNDPEENVYTWKLDDDGTLTVSGTGWMGEYMTDIGDAPWYSSRSKIKTVVIGEGITRIGSYLFANLKNLTKVTLPNSLTEIGNEVFINCSSLPEITIPGSVKTIGGNVFEYCTSLKKVTLMEGVKTIGSGAFWSCTSLTDIVLPDSLEGIGRMAFNNCKSLEEIVIPKGITVIRDHTFALCSGLKKIMIPDSVKSIEGSAFRGCTSLTKVTIPDSVTNIEDAFFECTGIEEVTVPYAVLQKGVRYVFDYSPIKTINFPDDITDIPENAFGQCTDITSFTIPESVMTIGNGAFFGCSNLKKIVIPKNVSSIGWKAFIGNEEYPSGFEKIAILNKDAAIDKTAFKDVVLYGYKGSTAETYAASNGLTFKPLVGITKQPEKTYAAAGKTATIKVTAESYSAMTYQWYYRTGSDVPWTAVSAANGKKASYSFTAAEKQNGYQYQCRITNKELNITVKSKIVTLTIVTDKAAITTQPKAATVASGDKATFKVAADGLGISYQWYYRTGSGNEWKAVSASSGKTANYTLTTAAKHNGYQYYCAVKNPVGTVKSKTVTLTVVASKPTITTQPKAASVTAGKKATFKVVAEGTALSYQWYYRTSSTANWKEVTAAAGKKAAYSLTTAKKHNGYQYKCKVTNLKGSVVSKVVKLTVK